MGQDLLAELTALTSLPGPSGDEVVVARHLAARLDRHGLTAETDAIGNLVLRGAEPVDVLVTAHMDQVGFMVSRVEELHAVCLPVGGPELDSVARARVFADGEIKTHGELEERGDEVGVLLRSEQHRLIRVGDRVLYEPRLELRDDGIIEGAALDNRIGCWLLLRAAAELAATCPGLALAWTVREESEGAGVVHAARALSPKWLVSVDTTSAGAEVAGGGSDLALGEGPAITLLDEGMVAYPPLLEAFARAAEQRKISWQPEVVADGSSEAGVAQSELGLPALALLVPVESPHSPAEKAGLRDIEQAETMLIAGLRETLSLVARDL